MSKTTLHVLALTAATVLMMAAECGKAQDPKPTGSTLCGTGPDGLIYCQVPADPSATPGMDPK